MKNSIVWFVNQVFENKGLSICVLNGVFWFGFFLFDAFTPNVTEINTVESHTIENGARFYMTKALKVKSLDGQSVKWKPKFTADAMLLLLSPGSHTFTVDFEASVGNTKWSAIDLKIGTDFKSGKYYRFSYFINKKAENISYSIEETDPVMYKSGKFTPRYRYLIGGAIALAIASLFVITHRDEGV